MPRFEPPAPPYLGPGKDSGDGNKPIHRIVLHGTVSATVDGGARGIAAYFRNPDARGSAHYVVDPSETIQTVYDSRVAWHAPPNEHSLGIEMCDWVGDDQGKPLPLSRWNDDPHTEMLERAARLTAELCLAYDVPRAMRTPHGLRRGRPGICEHSDVSQAFGQSTHWDLGKFPRRRFIRLVRAHVGDLQGDIKTAAKERRLSNSRVTKARDLLESALRHTPNKIRKRRIRKGLDALPKH